MGDFAIQGAGNEAIAYGADTTTSKGTVVTASATANTKGSYVEIDAAIANSTQGVTISISCTSGVTNLVEWLVDIAIGGAGNEEVIVSNIYFNATSNYDLDKFKKFYFPIEIAEGERVSVRCQQSTTDQNPIEVAAHSGQAAFTNSALYNEVVDIGADTTVSGGVTVDPGSTNNAKGSWTEMIASSLDGIKGIMVLAGVNANLSQRAQGILVDVGVGGSGNEEVVVGDIVGMVTADELVNLSFAFIPLSIPAGSRIAIRHQTSDASNATDRVLDFIIYGVVG